jgi:hypothetical protein
LLAVKTRFCVNAKQIGTEGAKPLKVLIAPPLEVVESWHLSAVPAGLGDE